MDLQKIAIFVDAVKLGSFSAVSKSRDLDASVISRSIASLEKDLGAKLFFRTTRKLALTEAGSDFFARVDPLLAEFERLRASLAEKRQTPSGIVRVTAPVSFGMLFLIPIAAKFQKRYPDVQIEMLVTDSILDLVNERIDLAIRFGHLEDSSFVSAKLAPLHYLACASPSYLSERGAPRIPQDLVNYNCLSFLIPGFANGWRFRDGKTGKEDLVRVKGSLKISSALGLREAAILGAGVSLLPSILVKSEIEDGRLINLFPGHEISATQFGANAWLLYPDKDFLPSRVRVFMDFLKNELRGEGIGSYKMGHLKKNRI